MDGLWNMELYLQIIYCAVATALGVIGGSCCVYCFNHIPASWLCAPGAEPAADLTDTSTQRLKSYPWKLIFSILLAASGIKMSMVDPLYALAGMILIWLLIELSVGAAKYGALPDQLILPVAVCAFGFANFHEGYMDMVYGMLLGIGVLTVISLLFRFVLKTRVVGLGDVKLAASLGLVLGLWGTVGMLTGMAVLACASHITLLVMKRIQKKDILPMAPYIATSVLIYVVVIWQV